MTRSVAKSPRVAEQCDINIHSRNVRTIGDGYRNFQPMSTDEYETSADTPSKLPYNTKERPLIYGGPSAASGLEPTTLWP
ncbi:hypothetical protein TNCV_4428341 [Trichonephila clavipes]|nr:hypothetical protein TNCV_4428341 [Trichonephila clavipes]